jgi:hypothetical protein
MADILPPAPVDQQFGAYQWIDWYQKVRNAINNSASIAWAIITGTPTTLAGYGITDGATKTGSRMNLGVDATDDIIIDLATKGLVLKDTAGTPHYWRITIDTAGTLVITDLGTTKP